MDLREKVSALPLAPGVYLYKDSGGRVIYVGKAKSLRARVRSYFSDERLADSKTGTLIADACDIDYIPKDLLWPAADHKPEDSFYLWGPDVPREFTLNCEAGES